MIPAGVIPVLIETAEEIAIAHANDWNGIRLAPAVALLHGYGLYTLPGAGPMLTHIYGPVSPLVYTPAALFPTPMAAIRIGVGLTFALCLLPAALVAWTSRPVDASLKVAAVVIFALYATGSDVLHYTSFWIHADTPAVVFSALACLPLMHAGWRRDSRWLAVSALAAVLAVGSKQPALPVVVALPAYLWLTDGWRPAARLGGFIAMWSLVAVAIMLLTLDVRAMLYQAFAVPFEHPWRFGDGRRAFVQTLRDFGPRALLPTVVVATVGAWHLRQVRGGLRAWAGVNPWLVPLTVAVCCFPTSVLGRMKAGGSMPALTFTIYPLAIAALAAVLQIGRSSERTGAVQGTKMLAAVLLVALATGTGIMFAGLPPVRATLSALRSDPDAGAFAFVRAHPGQVYLPQNPLMTLMAEGRLDGVVLPTLNLQYVAYAGRQVTAAGRADHDVTRPFTPRDMRYLMFRVHPGTTTTVRLVRPGALVYLRRDFPEFSTIVPVAPGWAAFVAAER